MKRKVDNNPDIQHLPEIDTDLVDWRGIIEQMPELGQPVAEESRNKNMILPLFDLGLPFQKDANKQPEA